MPQGDSTTLVFGVRAFRALAALLALGLAPACGDAASGEGPPAAGADAGTGTGTEPVTPIDFTALDAFLDARFAAGLRGFAMQIYDNGDHLVYQRETGVCANPPACPAGSPAYTVNLSTGIASSSKWVTSSTVLAVLDEQVAMGRVASL